MHVIKNALITVNNEFIFNLYFYNLKFNISISINLVYIMFNTNLIRAFMKIFSRHHQEMATIKIHVCLMVMFAVIALNSNYASAATSGTRPGKYI